MAATRARKIPFRERTFVRGFPNSAVVVLRRFASPGRCISNDRLAGHPSLFFKQNADLWRYPVTGQGTSPCSSIAPLLPNAEDNFDSA